MRENKAKSKGYEGIKRIEGKILDKNEDLTVYYDAHLSLLSEWRCWLKSVAMKGCSSASHDKYLSQKWQLGWAAGEIKERGYIDDAHIHITCFHYIHTYLLTYWYTYIHTYIHMYIYKLTYFYIYICIITYTYIIHAYMQSHIHVGRD